MKKIGIVVSFNSAEHLTRLIKELHCAGFDRIIVVDNGSEHSQVRKAEEIGSGFASVRLISTGVNLGFGAAVNRGLSSLVDEDEALVCLVNPDTYFLADDVRRLLRLFQDSPVDLASPRLTTRRCGLQVDWYSGGRILFDEQRIKMRQSFGTHTEHRAVRDVTFLPATFMVGYLNTFRRVGCFREDFFMYWEDADFCQRALQTGFRMGVLSSVAFFHEVGSSSGLHTRKSSDYFYYMSRNRSLFFSEHGSQNQRATMRVSFYYALFLLRAVWADRGFGSRLRGALDGLRDARAGRAGARRVGS